MPPRISVAFPSRPQLRSQRCLATGSPISLMRSKTTKSTPPPTPTTLTPAGQIPPESPKFIYIPKSRQPEQIHRPWIKGILPVPRNLFPSKHGKDKTSPEYLAAVTSEPKNAPASWKATLATTADPSNSNSPQKPAANFVVWKTQQAAARRRNLRESLVELHARKERIAQNVAARSASKHADYLRRAYAPEPLDEYLTKPSVPTATHPSTSAYHHLPDPNRMERLAQKRANVAAKEAQCTEERRAMLHTLYMHARDFITTPAALDVAIDQAFDNNSAFSTDSTRGFNIWNLGSPKTVEEMLKDAGKGEGGKAAERHTGFAMVTNERVTRIAEELTGGGI